MEIVKSIKLSDGGIYHSKTKAERHLSNKLSSGDFFKLYESMAGKSVLEVREILFKNTSLLNDLCNLVAEIEEVQKLDKSFL